MVVIDLTVVLFDLWWRIDQSDVLIVPDLHHNDLVEVERVVQSHDARIGKWVELYDFTIILHTFVAHDFEWIIYDQPYRVRLHRVSFYEHLSNYVRIYRVNFFDFTRLTVRSWIVKDFVMVHI